MVFTKKKLILPLFLALLMVLSTFGIILGSTSSKNKSIDYGGYKFTFDGQRWFTFKDKTRLEFLFDPKDLEDISTRSLMNKLSSYKKIYLSVNPEDNLQQETQFFRSTLVSLISKPINVACPNDNDLCSNLPIKDCKDSIQEEVFILKLSRRTNNSIQENESCITVGGDSTYFIKVLEKIRLEYFLNE